MIQPQAELNYADFLSELKTITDELPKESYFKNLIVPYIEKANVEDCYQAVVKELDQSSDQSTLEKEDLSPVESLVVKYKRIGYLSRIKLDIGKALDTFSSEAPPHLSTMIVNLKNLVRDYKLNFTEFYKAFKNQLQTIDQNSREELVAELIKIQELYKNFAEMTSLAPTAIKNQYEQLLAAVKNEIKQMTEKFVLPTGRIHCDQAITTFKTLIAPNANIDLESLITVLQTQLNLVRKEQSFFSKEPLVKEIEILLEKISKTKLARLLKLQAKDYERAIDNNFALRKETISTHSLMEELEKEKLNLTKLNITLDNLNLTQKPEEKEPLDTSTSFSLNTSRTTKKAPVETSEQKAYEYDRKKLKDWLNPISFVLIDDLVVKIAKIKKKIKPEGGEQPQSKDTSDINRDNLKNSIKVLEDCIFNLLIDVKGRVQPSPEWDYLSAMRQIYLKGAYLPKNVDYAEKLKEIRDKGTTPSDENASQLVLSKK